MVDLIIFALWFFLPAGYANAAPVFGSKIHLLDFLNKPIDAGRKWHGKRILGDHKTWRGLIFGTLIGILTAILQVVALKLTGWQIEGSFTDLSTAAIGGGLLGFGALSGDAVKSFFKRRVGVASGKSWAPFDQIDYVIGGLLFVSLINPLTFVQYFCVLIVWMLLHPVATFFGWVLKLKDSPF